MKRAFYLEYRPQRISELDLTEIREGLLKLVKSAKVPHALLFSGPRGTGKTSAARLVAKAVNCEAKKKTKGEPCNRCRACREITAGIALDLIEIDAASTRGIDDIRDLREKVKLAPTQLKVKTYIIDEVHMLTTEAFNALLKTLEEPPTNTVFILCTTAPEKLPETIISRCTRFNFRKAKIEEVVNSLQRVVRGEKLKVAKGALEEIARSVDGSFRDGQKILDQLATGRGQISLKATKELLGQVEALSPKKLLLFLAAKKTKEALLEINRIVNQGGDLATYNQALLDQLRLGLLTKAGLAEISAPEETQPFNLSQIRFLISLFSRAANQIKIHPIPQLPLELAVVEWGEGERAQAPPSSETRAGSGGGEKNNPLSLSGSPPNKPNVQAKGSQTANQSSSKEAPSPEGLRRVIEQWQEILAAVRPMNHSVSALLKASRPKEINGGVLILEVFYRFHKERLEEERCRQIVEEALEQFLGTPMRLKCILGQKEPLADTGDDQVVSEPSVSEEKPPADILKTAQEIFGVEV